MYAVIRVTILCVLLAYVYAGLAKPKANARKLKVEILTKNQTSIQARFRQYRQVYKYFVSVHVKNLADVSAHYTVTLKRRQDRTPDKYYYIDTGNTLQPGTLYEMSFYRGRTMDVIKDVDVFTDCDQYTYSCDSEWGPRCLGQEYLCDGENDCKDGSDEVKINSTCAVKLPEKPTPPPPPTDTPCMTALKMALNNTLGSIYDAPRCDDKNGHYVPMNCKSELNEPLKCYCQHPLTAEVLETRNNYNPFVDWGFNDVCLNKTETILGSLSNP